MPTEVLRRGVVTAITQNVIYALPASTVYLQAEAAVEVSLQATTNFATLAASTTGATTSAAFVRCTTGNTNIIVKRL
jgi:hypothetical protein